MARPKSANTNLQRCQADGIVEHIDLINREVDVLVDGQLMRFDVPTQCNVVLRGERIKLRIIRLQDRVRVRYSVRGACIVADAIEVQFSG